MTPEIHPLQPFLPDNAVVLMLGSFPPARNRWSMDFYYPNIQNDMWRIMGLLFFGDRDALLTGDRRRFDRDRIVAFCSQRGIALSDTAAEVVRLKDNASDRFLEVTARRDIGELLDRLPKAHAVVTTGRKASDTFRLGFECDEPAVGFGVPFMYGDRSLVLYRMPSSSRAYPMRLELKAEAYGRMFRELGML